jgi:hypothetical protein
MLLQLRHCAQRRSNDAFVHSSCTVCTNNGAFGQRRFFQAFSNQEEVGGRDRVRTCDPLLAKQVLSQLSYTPTVTVDDAHSKAFPRAPKSIP